MKIFLTGSTSSIGNYLTKKLLDEGHSLNLLVRSISDASYLAHSKVAFYEGDITNLKIINEAMKDCNQVYHLAAIAKVWLKDPTIFFKINVLGTDNILKAAFQNKINKIVITSSAGVYGPSLQGTVNENTVRSIDFFNEYESSKAMVELLVAKYIVDFKMNITIVSPTRVYGPLIHGKPASTNLLISNFVNSNWRILPGSGAEIGNYAFIEDVAEGHILAMNLGRSGHNYILGGENCSYSTFFNTLKKVAKIERKMLKIPFWVQSCFAKFQLLLAELVYFEPSITPKWLAKVQYNWDVSSEKAIKELGYKTTKLNDGLKKTVESFNNQKI